MKIHQITRNNNPTFGNKYKLSEETIKLLEQNTKLPHKKMKSVSIEELANNAKKHTPFLEKVKHKCKKIKDNIDNFILVYILKI